MYTQELQTGSHYLYRYIYGIYESCSERTKCFAREFWNERNIIEAILHRNITLKISNMSSLNLKVLTNQI